MSLGGNNARIFLNDVDLSCVTSAYDIENTTGEVDTTTICSTSMEYTPLSNRGKIGINGFFKGIIAGEQKALENAIAAQDKVVAAVLDYTNLPAVSYCLENAGNMNVTYSFPVEGVAAITGSFVGTQGLKRGMLNYYKTTITATGLSAVTQVPNTLVTSTGKVFAFLHTINGTASTNIAFAVQSSANGSTGWANECTFSMPAVGASVASFTAPLGEYFTINTTSLGGATSFVLSLIFVIEGVTT